MTRRGILLIRLLFALSLFPLATGLLTLTYRDASATHLGGKIVTAELLASGRFPFIHPGLSCGQPLAGNPNFATFLPDTLLFLVLPPLLAFSLHFVFAAILAWAGARRWARIEGASRGAAEIAALAFVLSGVFVSTWIFYNSGFALAVAPWLAAAASKLGRRSGAGNRNAAARSAVELALWGALEIVAGEPVVALLAFVTAAVAGICGLLAPSPVPRRARLALAAPMVAAGLALAALLAAPQIATTWQMSRGTARDLSPFDFEGATAQSVDPALIAEQAVAFPFGRPDLSGAGRFDGWKLFFLNTPYLWTLHLGWIPLLLLALYGRPASRTEQAWWVLALAAVVLSTGRFLPGAKALFPILSIGGRIRLPVKWWYVVVLALVPLVAWAIDRRRESARPRRWAGIALVALLASGGAIIAVRRDLTSLDFASLAVSVLGAGWLLSCAADGTSATGNRLALVIAASLGLAVAPILLASLDAPPALDPVAFRGRIFARIRMFPHPPPGYPDPPEKTTREVYRRAFVELWQTTGVARGARYAFDEDPDGSYCWYDAAMRGQVDTGSWTERVAELRIAGVERVITDQALPPPYRPAESLNPSHRVRAWTLAGAAADVRFATRVFREDGSAATAARHRTPTFDPATDCVVAGPGRSAEGPPIPVEVTVSRNDPDQLVATLDAPSAGVLVWSRSYFPAWRATVDGQPVDQLIAEGHLVGVAVEKGPHQVRIVWPRWPLEAGAAAAAIAAAVAIAWRRRATRKP